MILSRYFYAAQYATDSRSRIQAAKFFHQRVTEAAAMWLISSEYSHVLIRHVRYAAGDFVLWILQVVMATETGKKYFSRISQKAVDAVG